MHHNRSLASHIKRLIEDCEAWSRTQQADRERAANYYNGDLTDLPVERNAKGEPLRSTVVTKDLRAVVKKLMPSVMRTLLSNDRIVEYTPTRPETEAMAEQATHYVNQSVIPECGAEDAIRDAIFDALILKTGILKWSAWQRKSVKIHTYTDQPSEALLGLEGEPDIKLLDHEDRPETDPYVLALDPEARRHDFKIRRVEARTDIRLEAVPRSSFLIHPGSQTIDEAPIVGERQLVTRSDLIERGFDKAHIEPLLAHDRRGDSYDHTSPYSDEPGVSDYAHLKGAMEEIMLYEVYVRLDEDGDGIAELYKICFAESSETDRAEPSILSMEEVDEAPYAAVHAERVAHGFEGHSISEDVIDIQRIKSALTRETLDNIYWQNKPQPAIDVSKLTDQGLEAIYNPGFGQPIITEPGYNLRDAVDWHQVPFMADKTFGMLGYLDDMAREHTGITDQSGGLNPEAFQNMTATSAQLMSESGIAQAEMIIRSLARGGIRKAFKGLLKLIIAHADKPRTIRLRGKWVDYDPRSWDSDMDCTVNVGLGAGSKERDLQILQIILGLQEKLLAAFGPDNPFVKPAQLYNTMAKITEAAGLPNPGPYFTEPDEDEIARKMQAPRGPSETEMKINAQMKLEAAKAEARKSVEAAQLQADLQVKSAERQNAAEMQLMKAQKDHEIAELKGKLEYRMHLEKIALDREKLGLAPSPDGQRNGHLAPTPDAGLL